MLWIAIGIGFMLLFGVLISDEIFGNFAARSGIKPTDASSRPRKPKGAAVATPATRRARTIGTRRPADGLGRAA